MYEIYQERDEIEEEEETSASQEHPLGLLFSDVLPGDGSRYIKVFSGRFYDTFIIL